MSERIPEDNPLIQMAARISEVLNGMQSKLPMKPDEVDVRTIAELCWAIGVEPSLTLFRRPPNEPHEP